MARKSTQTSEPIVSSSGQAAASAPAKKHRSSRSQTSRILPESEVSTAAIASLAQAVSPDQVARLAYSYWEARGCQGGSPEEDWLRAEQELRATPAAAGQ